MGVVPSSKNQKKNNLRPTIGKRENKMNTTEDKPIDIAL